LSSKIPIDPRTGAMEHILLDAPTSQALTLSSE